MPFISRSLDVANGRVIHQWFLKAPIGRVWWGLTDPAALSQWLGTLTEGAFRTGAIVTIQHAEDYSCTSQIVACEPEKLLAMSWNFPDEDVSTLQIKLTSGDDAVGLVLTHDDLGEEATNYLPGWHTHLTYLEDLLLGQPVTSR